MRIALLTHAFPPETGPADGALSIAWLRARALAARGHHVHVFAGADQPTDRTSHDGTLTISRYHAEDALARRLASAAQHGGDLALLQGLRTERDLADGLQRALQRAEADDAPFDVALCALDNAVAGLVVRGRGTPVVALVDDAAVLADDGGLHTTGRLLQRTAARALLNDADAVVASDDWLADRVRASRALRGPLAVVRSPARPPSEAPPAVPSGWPADWPTPEQAASADGGRPVLAVLAPSDRATAVRDLAADLATQLDNPPRVVWLLDDSGSWQSDPTQADPGGDTDDFLALLPSGDLERQAWMHGATLVAVLHDHPPLAARAVRLAMQASRAPVAFDQPVVRELLRTEVDGLLVDLGDTAALASAVRRLWKAPRLRERLGAQAAARLTHRHDPDLTAARLEAFLQATVLRRSPEPEQLAGTGEPALLLGPDTWHQAWWLRGTASTPTELARDAAGDATLLQLPLPALRYVIGILTRAFGQYVADWSAAEWQLLQHLRRGVLDRLAAARQDPDGDDADRPRLGLPALDDQLVQQDRLGLLLDDLWQLHDDAETKAWLEREVGRQNFVSRARDDLQLRRFALEAAELAPSVGSFEVLRQIYRNKSWQAVVVAADRQALAAGSLQRFGELLERHGLHAPLQRPPFTPRRVRGRNDATEPRVTVLIPSYKHEAFIADAIKSCLAQTAEGVRVLVADDRSPDGTVEAARAIDDPRLTVTVNDSNLGLGASVLAALERVETPFVALLNSDDLFHPERLEQALAVLESDADAALVATGFTLVDRDSRLLTRDTSCLVEDGPQAHGWLRWFDDVTRDLHEPADWTDLAVLLRHNVLATSSNMVFRSDYLREHMPAARSLRYCLDWQLFLVAAAQGRLRYVPGELLAYRFHGSNTVWFKGGERGDYVLEVNRVVDHVLSVWLRHRLGTAGDAPQAALTRLTGLLQEHVVRHGETDGYALYTAALARAAQTAGATVADGTTPPWERLDLAAAPVEALARAAQLRSVLDQVGPQLGCDPWSLPWRAQAADRLHIEHSAAEAFLQNNRDLHAEVEHARRERDRLSERTDDIADVRRALTADLQRVRDQRDRLQSDLQDAKDAVAGLRRELDERVRRLQGERDQRSAELEALRREHAELQGRHDALEVAIAELRERLEAARRTETELRERLREQRERAERAGARAGGLQTQVDRLTGERDTQRAAAAAARSDAAAERVARELIESRLAAAQIRHQRLLASPSWRLGHAWLDRSVALKAFKTIDDLGARGWERIWRFGAHAARLAHADGRARRRLALAVHDRPDQPLPATLRVEAALWREAGFDLRTLRWNLNGAPGPRARRLRDRRSLQRADRDYWRRRQGEQLAVIEGLLDVDHPWLGRALRFARIAKTWGIGMGLCHGFDGSGLQAWVAARLAGIPYTLILGGHAAARRELPETVARLVRDEARLLVVDSSSAADAPGGGRRDQHTLRRLLPQRRLELGEPPATDSSGRLRLLTLWPTFSRADGLTLVQAIAALRADGIAVNVDVLGEPGDHPDEITNWARFAQACREAQVRDCFTDHGTVDDDRLLQLAGSADAIVWCGLAEPGAGLPTAIPFAWASGRPVIATATPAVAEWLAGGEHGRALAPGDVAALAAALRELQAAPAAAREQAAQTREWFARQHAATPGSRALHDAVRELLDQG